MHVDVANANATDERRQVPLHHHVQRGGRALRTIDGACLRDEDRHVSRRRRAASDAERDLRVDRPRRGALVLLERASFVAEHAALRVTGCVLCLGVAEELVGGAAVARHRALVASGEEACGLELLAARPVPALGAGGQLLPTASLVDGHGVVVQGVVHVDQVAAAHRAELIALDPNLAGGDVLLQVEAHLLLAHVHRHVVDLDVRLGGLLVRRRLGVAHALEVLQAAVGRADLGGGDRAVVGLQRGEVGLRFDLRRAVDVVVHVDERNLLLHAAEQLRLDDAALAQLHVVQRLLAGANRVVEQDAIDHRRVHGDLLQHPRRRHLGPDAVELRARLVGGGAQHTLLVHAACSQLRGVASGGR